MSKVLKYVLPVLTVAAPVLAPLAFPATMASIGTALGAGAGYAGMVGGGLTGAAISGVGSALQGKSVGSSLGSALLGGVSGVLSGGGADALTGAVGLTGTGADVAKGALIGASAGAQSGGGTGALTGALLGGAASGLTGALSGSSSGLDLSNASELGGEVSNLGGSGSAVDLSGGMGSLTTGTGLAAGGGTSAVGGSMNLSDALKLGSSLYSGYSSQDTYDKMQKQLTGALSPYTTAGATATNQLSDALTKGFNYNDYFNSDVYNNQLAEGQKALTAQLASQGLGQSGAAVKAATDYATNLANKNYGDAYNQWLQKNNQLAGLSGTGANAAAGLGTTTAALTGAGQESINKMLAEISQNNLVTSLLNKTGLFA